MWVGELFRMPQVIPQSRFSTSPSFDEHMLHFVAKLLLFQDLPQVGLVFKHHVILLLKLPQRARFPSCVWRGCRVWHRADDPGGPSGGFHQTHGRFVPSGRPSDKLPPRAPCSSWAAAFTTHCGEVCQCVSKHTVSVIIKVFQAFVAICVLRASLELSPFWPWRGWTRDLWRSLATQTTLWLYDFFLLL